MSVEHAAVVCRRAAASGRTGAVIAWSSAVLLALVAGAAGAQGPFPAPRYDREVLSGPRLGEVPGGFATWKDLFAEQARLNAAALAIENHPDAAAQLGGIIADPTDRRLRVYWKGAPTQRTRELLTRLQRDVRIEWSRSRYSQAELLAAAEKLVRQPGVVWAAANADASGLDVTLDQHMARLDRQRLMRDIQQGAFLAARADPMAVNVAYGPAGVPVHTRDVAGSPAYAGTRIFQNWNSSACSLGFAALNKSGALGWLTAYHCNPYWKVEDKGGGGFTPYDGAVMGGKKKDTKGSWRIGTFERSGTTAVDVAFIVGGNNSYVQPFVFVGRAYGDDAAVPVGSTAPTYKNNYLFASGSSTGLTGALKVTKVRVAYLKTGYQTRAEHIKGAAAVGEGDSGGPVFAFMTDGRAEARGVMTMKEPETIVDCPSNNVVRLQLGDYCTSAMWFADTDMLARDAGLEVLTGNWP